ncbi:MAG TPA: hypothetical protein VN081_05880 [Dongiaceae bacterium]|nr:hypothetical protein [Dongiaceae bacterium]
MQRAAQYERGSHPESELEDTVEDYLAGLYDVFKNGLPGNGRFELHDLIKLRQQTGADDPFLEEPKLGLLADELQDGLWEYHIERTAGLIVYFDKFLEAYPQLVRLKAEDGPFLRGIDAELSHFDTSDAPARLIAYDESGEAIDVTAPTRLFVNKAALSPQQAQIIERYYHGMGL